MSENENNMEMMIQQVLDKPPRHDPPCDISAQVMSRIASEPQQVYEEDMNGVVMACGIAVLIALAIGVDYFLVGDWQSFALLEVAVVEPLSGQTSGLPILEWCCGLVLIPLLYILLGQKDSLEQMKKDL